MSTLTTNDIKNVGQLQEKNEFASNDALLAWDAAGQKHVKLTYQKLNQAYSTIQSACETAQGAAEDSAAEAAGFAKGTGGGTYTNNNAEYFKTQAAAEALKSEGWAEGTENGTEVPSTSPYHEHNSKYWATQAGTSAGSAGTDALKAEGFAVGQQNGTDVPSTSPYYENNAAYYADQASDRADAAAGSASDAEEWAEIARDAAAGALGNFFGTCSTLAGTAAKDVAISEFSLYTGVKVQVKFTNGHTLTATKDANGVVTADYPTLNVSSTGAKAIKVGAEYAGENFVTAGDTHEFIYDGTYWIDLTAVNIYENSTTARKRDGQTVGKVYAASLPGTLVCGGQAFSQLGSLTLPAGSYVLTACAKTADANSLMAISISQSNSMNDEKYKQVVYGQAGFDVNAGSVTAVMELSTSQTLYFMCWCNTNMSITPTSFSAIRIK